MLTRTKRKRANPVRRQAASLHRPGARPTLGVERLEARALLSSSQSTLQVSDGPPETISASQIVSPTPVSSLDVSISMDEMEAAANVPDGSTVDVSATPADMGGLLLYRIPIGSDSSNIVVKLKSNANQAPMAAEVLNFDAAGRGQAGWVLSSDAGTVAVVGQSVPSSASTFLTIGVAPVPYPASALAAGLANTVHMEILRLPILSAGTPMVQGRGNPAAGLPTRGGNSPSATLPLPPLPDGASTPPASAPGDGGSNPNPATGNSSTATSPPALVLVSQPPAGGPASANTPPLAPPSWSPGRNDPKVPPSAAEGARGLSIDLAEVDRLPGVSVNDPALASMTVGSLLAGGTVTIIEWRMPDGTPMLGAAPSGGRPSPLFPFSPSSESYSEPTLTPEGEPVAVLSNRPGTDRRKRPPMDRASTPTGPLGSRRFLPGVDRNGEAARGEVVLPVAPFLIGVGGSTALFASLLLPDVDAAVEAGRDLKRRRRGRRRS